MRINITNWTTAYITSAATSTVAVIMTRDAKHCLHKNKYGKALVKRFD